MEKALSPQSIFMKQIKNISNKGVCPSSLSNKKHILLVIQLLVTNGQYMNAQTFDEKYDEFKNESQENYYSFRDECNKAYIEFVKTSWGSYEGKAPIPTDESPIPPRPYNGGNGLPDIDIRPIAIAPIDKKSQPILIEPIREIPNPNIDYFTFSFYGQKCSVRLPESVNLSLKDCQPNSIATGWERLCNDEMNNAIRDCLETRIRYNLCDWAYLNFLNQLAYQYCKNPNSATLLTGFLYCQSGYQMRLAVDGSKLVLLYGSKHQIFDKGYFNVDGVCFYPLDEPANSMSICGLPFRAKHRCH